MDFIIPVLLSGLLLVLVLIGAIAMWLRAEFRRQTAQKPADSERLSRLEKRVTALEGRLAPAAVEAHEPRIALAHRETSPGSVLPEGRPAPAPVLETPSLPPVINNSPSGEAWAGMEARIAGWWLNRVGIIAVLFAVAFFLKYAFDNGWIGPTGRVTTGIIGGILMLVWSDWLARREYTYFSDGIAGLGAGVLYLSIYAAWNYYALIPQAGAFGAMIAVTAGVTAIALARGSQRIALVALVGGYATPLLVSSGVDAQFALFAYLLVLNGGMLLVSANRDWKPIAWLAFGATLTYYVGWCISYYDVTKLLPTTVWATLFFAQFEILPVLHTKKTGILPPGQTLLILANSSWYLITLHQLLEADHRWALTIAVLLLSAAHLVVARLLPDQAGEKSEGPSVCRVVFAGLALTFVTLAIPIRLEGRWITIAWAVEGALLVRTGLTTRLRLLRGAGLLLLATAAARMWLFPIPAPTLLFNGRFAASLVVAGCAASAIWLARRGREFLKSEEEDFFMALGVLTNILLLWALSSEVWDVLGRQGEGATWDVNLSRQLGLSLLWVIYASLLTMIGFRTSQSGWRWQGLCLFGIVVFKAFVYDLSSLDRLYRIVSFIVLGAVLLAVSFFYQRRLLARKTRSASPGEGL